jgi:hypothetical protein
MADLKITKTRALPLDAVTQTLAFIARKGAGKTYAAGKLVEELLGAGAPVVVLDPVGNWYGLRLAADGKRPGLPIPVLGGLHGDMPLSQDSGRAVAELVMGRMLSAVLDVSSFRKSERKRFVADFAERLFELAKGVRSPVHVVLEEAQLFAPQQAQGEERMLGAIEDLVRLGRNYGLGTTLITQRPQSVNKEVLNQVECLFIGQLSGSHERKAIDAWVVENAEGEQLDTRALASLPVGTMYLWSPQWLGTFEKVQIAKKQTFDASATPEIGKRHQARTLAPVDMEELRGALADVEAKAAADDPVALRREILRLERAVAQLERDIAALKAAPAPEPIATEHWTEVPVFLSGELGALQKAAQTVETAAEAAAEAVRGAAELVRHIATARAPAQSARPAPAPRPSPAPRSRPLHMPSGSDGEKMGKAERTILIALAQHGPLSLTQAAMIGGYSSKSGGMRNAAAQLRTMGYVTGGNDQMMASDAGLEALGHWEPLPEGAELAEHWYRQLGKAEREILRVVVDAYPEEVPLAQAAEANNYAASSGGVRNAAAKLRTLMLVEGGNAGMRAAARLCG